LEEKDKQLAAMEERMRKLEATLEQQNAVKPEPVTPNLPTTPPLEKKRGGRPKGSKNKPKTD
jgi:hypothetical protein